MNTGILHHYATRLTAFEHKRSALDPSNQPGITRPSSTSYILFLGGLGDGLLHPSYPSLLPPLLPKNWHIVEVLLSSSYTGWTTSNLAKDADEVALAVKYFRGLQSSRDVKKENGHDHDHGNVGRGQDDAREADDAADVKIVLMGHSTGAQICMEYVTARSSTLHGTIAIDGSSAAATRARPLVDGIVLQAGISDREGLTLAIETEMLKAVIDFANEWVRDGRGDDILPNDISHMIQPCTTTSPISTSSESINNNASLPTLTSIFGAAPSAQRFLSLATHNGADDFFSSDLTDEEIASGFGMLGKTQMPLLVLLSGEDEFMPAWVDKEVLLERWRRVVLVGSERADGGAVRGRWSYDSAVIEGAGHALVGGRREFEEVLRDVAGKIKKFLKTR